MGIFLWPVYVLIFLLRLLFSRHWPVAVAILGAFVLFVFSYGGK